MPALLSLLFAAALAAPPPESPVKVVTRLYRDYAWEAVISEPIEAGQSLFDLPKEGLGRYFDDSLIALLLEDQACQKREGGICNLDFDPIWASQDPGGTTDVKITATNAPGVVRVRFKYADGKAVTLTYHLVKTGRGWRISDIDEPAQPSLRKLLRGR